MKKANLSRLLSITLAMSMTVGMSSFSAVSALADSGDAENEAVVAESAAEENSESEAEEIVNDETVQTDEVETVVELETDAEETGTDAGFSEGTEPSENVESENEDTYVVGAVEDSSAAEDTSVPDASVSEEAGAENSGESIEIETVTSGPQKAPALVDENGSGEEGDSAGQEGEENPAEDPENTEEDAEFSGYVLMNIPYSEFYAAEGVSGVDAVSSATVKTYNQTMAGGSYHAGYGAPEDISEAQILGVTYPVKVSGKADLEGLTEVKNEDKATISVAAGKSGLTTEEVSGKDLLFASGTHA
ncbi:MAG: hypothetical protein IJ860_04925, partial [Eubacterium sp.]|nr:hypothetical protein [Eubacterium sp.]